MSPSSRSTSRNIYKREPFRHTAMCRRSPMGVICGFGGHGYELALDALAQHPRQQERVTPHHGRQEKPPDPSRDGADRTRADPEPCRDPQRDGPHRDRAGAEGNAGSGCRAAVTAPCRCCRVSCSHRGPCRPPPRASPAQRHPPRAGRSPGHGQVADGRHRLSRAVARRRRISSRSAAEVQAKARRCSSSRR